MSRRRKEEFLMEKSLTPGKEMSFLFKSSEESVKVPSGV